MTDNPYDSPSSVTTKTIVEPRRMATARPVGVSILAVLHLVGGVLLLGAQFLLFANLEAMKDSLRSIGISPVLLIIGAIFLATLTIASGVGMWMGTKWGWWLAAFYYVYSVSRNGSALVTVIAMSDQLGDSRGPEYYMAKHGGRVVIHFLLFLYFFKGNVLEFFRLEALDKAKAVGILVGICIAITVAMSTIGVISS